MAQVIEKRHFDEGINADDSLTKLTQGEYFNGFNFRGVTSEDGHISGLQPIHSTKKLYALLPVGTNYCMGSEYDESQQRIVWANWNSNGNHGIYCYDVVNFAGMPVLLNSQITGGLNFDRFHYIHSSFILNGCWYFTDNLNQPRRININGGIEMNFDINNPPPGYVPGMNVPVLHSQDGVKLTDIYLMPTNPVPSYQSGQLLVWLDRTGNAGPNAPATFIPIIAAADLSVWSQLPGKSYQQITLDAINRYFGITNPSGGNVNSFLSNGNPGITVSNTWDWNLGDPTFPPTFGVDLRLSLFERTDGQPTNPYISPISQSDITWIRRQPALPPVAIKVNANTGTDLVSNNAFRFSVRYTCREFETSTLGPQSRLVNYGSVPISTGGQLPSPGAYISVTLPLAESIDQEVIQIELVAEYLNSGDSFVIKSWMNSNTADLFAIQNHNNGVAALSYNFYNDSVGIAVASADAVKPFDSVPLVAKTAERAKNRSFIGDYTIGYSTPISNSLAISLSTITASNPSSTVIGQVVQVMTLATPFAPQRVEYYIFIPGLGYYGYVSNLFLPPPTIPFSALTFDAGSDAAFLAYLQATFGASLFGGFGATGKTTTVTGAPFAATVAGTFTVMKAGASYRIGITFYDFAGRKCGYYTNDSLRISIPERDVSLSQYVNAINWVLSNALGPSEIPVWAASYSIDISLCLLTRSFIQTRTTNATYFTKDATGKNVYGTLIYTPGLAGVAIDMSYLLQQQMGYVFSQGDFVRLYPVATGITFPNGQQLTVLGTDGNWLLCSLANVGTLNSVPITGAGLVDWVFQIYTPYQPSATEPVYECGAIYPVSNPGTAIRNYSQPSGSIEGDTTVLIRNYNALTLVADVVTSTSTVYYCEAMSPNDAFYKIWNTDAGRPNFIDTIGQVTQTGSIAYSNTLVAGSQINGLSNFDALNAFDLSSEFGALQKLILSSKIQMEGSVMLAICVSETVSLYLGETQVAAPQGNAFLSVSSGVIGTVYPLKGSHGCGDPESVQQWNGDVFWFNRYKDEVVQYSDNGLEAVSRFKMRTFWRSFSQTYKRMTQTQLEALGSRPFVIGGIDPFNGEYLLSLPCTLAANPNGLLPGGMLNTPTNHFNIWDGQPKTMVYKIEVNKWMPALTMTSEALVYADNVLIGFSAGVAYQHNDTGSGYNTLYGRVAPSIIVFAGNKLPNSPKLVVAMNVETDCPPDVCYLYSAYPNKQITDIQPTEWNQLEGIYYTSVKRDRLSPAFTDPDLALNMGDEILAKAPMFQLNFIPTGPFSLKYVNIRYKVSAGHQTIETK